MTDAIIRALSEVDEVYLDSYGNRKPAKTAYLKNRKVLAAAAVLIISISIGTILMTVNNNGTDKGFVRESYESFEDFVKKASSPPDGLPIDLAGSGDYPNLLMQFDTNEYEKPEYYSVRRNSGNLGVLGPEIYVLKLVKDGKTCEIAYQPNADDSSDMPDRFRTETPYSGSVVIDGVRVGYRQQKKLTEGEFTADSGYYKVICYSDLFSDFSDFVTNLLR